MADKPTTDKPSTPVGQAKPKSSAGDAAAATPSTQEGTQQRVRVDVVDKDSVCSYANFCRVTGTPEELILDFGLNAQPYGIPSEPVEVKQRIVLNYFTAKRTLQALSLSVQRHEQAFGVLETDVQKRGTGGGTT